MAIVVSYVIVVKVLRLRVIKLDEVAVIEKRCSFKYPLRNSIIAIGGESGLLL